MSYRCPESRDSTSQVLGLMLLRLQPKSGHLSLQATPPHHPANIQVLSGATCGGITRGSTSHRIHPLPVIGQWPHLTNGCKGRPWVLGHICLIRRKGKPKKTQPDSTSTFSFFCPTPLLLLPMSHLPGLGPGPAPSPPDPRGDPILGAPRPHLSMRSPGET